MSEITGLILFSALATYAWRAAGVIWAGRVATGSPGFRLASCVAYAILMALIVKMVADPGSANLAATNLWTRIAGMGATAIVYFGFGRNVPLSAWAGVGVFALAEGLAGGMEGVEGVE